MKEKFIEAIKTLYNSTKIPVILCDMDYNIMWKNPNSIIADITSEEIKSVALFKEDEISIIKKFFYDSLNLTIRGVILEDEGERQGYFLRAITSSEVSACLCNADIANRQLAMSSNIREHVARIVGITNLLQEKADSAERYDDLKAHKIQLNSCYKILAAVINSNEFAQYSFEDINETYIDASADLVKILDAIAPYLKRENVTLIYDKIDEGVFIKANRNRCLCAFMNMLVNAVQYNISEEKIVKVSLKKLGDQVILSVTDNGVGISEESRAKIDSYKNFFSPKTKAYDKKNMLNYGSGFKVIHAFCETYKFNLLINTKENQGSTVSIKMPCYEVEQSQVHSRIEDIIHNRFSNLYVILSKICTINIL